MKLSKRLEKYIVVQSADSYTAIEQASWRYILRQLRSYLKKHAHPSYSEGLKKTGISVNKIPSVQEISDKLSHFGWRALPVSGFIPPAIFMELQSLGILPIASAMRTLEHLTYTPAPDIVHEAAGHAPLLSVKEYSDYLKAYAEVARNAIISSEDLAVYSAIRDLSDIKENPSSTPAQIREANENLNTAYANISHLSEATYLGRMNWWTAEYGLIGDIKQPRIFGAGLLSSVAEAKYCLSPQVKKIPLTVDCIHRSYDITEPQPQLYVAQDFNHLNSVLNDLSALMGYKNPSVRTLFKLILSKTVNTVELNTGLQISGTLTGFWTQDQNNQIEMWDRDSILKKYVNAEKELTAAEDIKSKIIFLKFSGATQICYKNQELTGHGCQHHSQGYSTPIGGSNLSSCGFENKTAEELSKMQYQTGKQIQFTFNSSIKLEGELISILKQDSKNLMSAFKNAKVQFQDQVLFQPEWGTFDLAHATHITQIRSGAADTDKFGETDEFVARKLEIAQHTDQQKKLFSWYQKVRELRETYLSAKESQLLNDDNTAFLRDKFLALLYDRSEFSGEWLLLLEMYELWMDMRGTGLLDDLSGQILLKKLEEFKKTSEGLRLLIEDGISLSNEL